MELLTELKWCSHIAEGFYTGMSKLSDVIIFPYINLKRRKKPEKNSKS